MAVSALNGFQAFDVAHTDFITVVDERRTWHGKKESESNRQLIPADDGDYPYHGFRTGCRSGLSVRSYCSWFCRSLQTQRYLLSAFGEEWLIAAEQIVVMGRFKVKQEVHVEAAL